MLRAFLLLLAAMLPVALPVAVPVIGATPVAAQEAEEQVIITGVVRDIDTGLPPHGAKTVYTHSIRLAGWRQDDQPVETMVLWIRYETENSLRLDELGQIFPTGELIRFTVKDGVAFRGEPGGLQTASADFVEMLPTVSDKEVMAAADRLLNPPAINDANLGRFKADPPHIENFGQQREWLGEQITFELLLNPLSPTAREHALAMAQMAWQDRKAIDANIREAVTDHIYSNRVHEAGIVLVPVDGKPLDEEADEMPKLSREAFKADHKLVYIHCSAQDYCSYSYVAQTAGWEWSYWATIRRDKGDDGWYLDGWVF